MSDSHVIMLKQGQSFEVLLSDGHVYFEDVNVGLNSSHLSLDRVHRIPTGRIYTFSQVGDFENWSRVSTNFLGEIQFTSLANKSSSRVCVYLQATNSCKADIVTVINPLGHTVKIHPHQILEVVLHSPIWGMQLYWEAEFSDDPRFEMIAHAYVQPYAYNPGSSVRKIDDAFFMYPRSLSTSDRPFYEFHFWMRCNPKVANHIRCLPTGAYPDGKMTFNGCVGMDIKTTCNLNIIFNDRDRAEPSDHRSSRVTYLDSDMAQGKIAENPRSETVSPSRQFAIVPAETKRYANYESDTPRDPWKITIAPYVNKWCSSKKFRIKRIASPIFHGCEVQFIEDIKQSCRELG